MKKLLSLCLVPAMVAALGAADPDLVILRNSEYIKDSEITAEAIDKIENELKIPLVVVNGPGCYDEVTIETQYEGVRLLGQLFQKEERAQEIISLMEETISMIEERTADIPEEEKPSVMYIGGLKGDELTGTVWGADYGDAKFSQEAAGIWNVYPEHEAIRKVSAEQLLALNPDEIILCTVSPDPEVFLTDTLYSPISDITAIQNGDVASIGLLTWWGDFRLEVPTILLAPRVRSVMMLDPSRAMLDLAEAHGRTQGLTNLVSLHETWEDADPARLGKADYAIASYSLAMPDQRAAIGKMNAVARKGVYLYWFNGLTTWEKITADLRPVIYGEAAPWRPKSDIIYGLLSQMGISADVKDLEGTAFDKEFSDRRAGSWPKGLWRPW